MADTQRTRAQLRALFADNVTGQISAQDLRDFLVTMMEDEFASPGDFWAGPDEAYLVTPDTGRGWKMYSQEISLSFSIADGLSFGQIVMFASTSAWRQAAASDSIFNRAMLGVMMGSYADAATDCIILRKGLVYDSMLSASMVNKNGWPVFLCSDKSEARATISNPTQSRAIGVVISANYGMWYFDPTWAVVGT